MAYYSEQQRAKFVEKIDRLREKGLTLAEACEKVGVAGRSYKNWKDNGVSSPYGDEKPAKVVFNKTPEQKTKRKYNKKSNKTSENKVFAFFGSPEDIKQLVGELNG